VGGTFPACDSGLQFLDHSLSIGTVTARNFDWIDHLLCAFGTSFVMTKGRHSKRAAETIDFVGPRQGGKTTLIRLASDPYF
jgi:hypothetical protein